MASPAPYGVGPSGGNTGSGSGFFNGITTALGGLATGATDFAGGLFSEETGKAIGKGAAQILPRWTAQNLKSQRKNQLAKPTFNPSKAQPKMGNPKNTLVTGKSQVQDSGVQKSLWDTYKGTNISGGTIIAGVVAAVSVVAVALLS
jgi:hypothetical protein